MKPLVAVTVAVVAFLTASSAQAGWSQRVPVQRPSLSLVAASVTGREIQVHLRVGDTGYGGSAWVGYPAIWLTHDALGEAARGRGIGMLVFLHELGHTTGIDNEGLANCFALQRLRPVLRDLYGFTASRAEVEFGVSVDYMRSQSAVYQCQTP